ncbi:hypothetical protein [Leyella stercorea]|uniref:hypothetical protein n=1 Tax=Leyella stercorea TaxID=363265 RepID=UPI001A4ACAC5|nr:hypothetical protein [Leyella stercorea]MBL6516965.1 hypothetical protein [Leyella stercorea]
MEEVKRGRAKKKLLRVIFPNGKVLCYKNTTETMIATMQELGVDIMSKVKLELCHLPLLFKEIHPKYKEWMKPVCDGWYLNTQSNSDSKFLQLNAINEQLSLGLTVELGDDFETQDNPNKERRTKTKDKLLVKFPDGQYFANNSATDTFLEVIWEIGVDKIKQKEMSWCGKPLITTSKMFNGQVQIDNQRWIIVPNTTKDKVKLLRVIGAILRINMEITSI